MVSKTTQASSPLEQSPSTHEEYSVLPKHLPNSDLPFIIPNEVSSRNGNSGTDIWLVIDAIVYNITPFVNSHPGGDAVLRSFAGKDCSWQFHKIHGLQKEKERKWLPGLRVGRTERAENPYPQQ